MKGINNRKLIKIAKQYAKKAFVPFSHFKVGAAVLMEDNSIYGGCNIENISYPATVCAEIVAATKAISEKRQKIKCLTVFTNAKEPWPPCGNCLQFILPYSFKDTKVILANHKGVIKVMNIFDLMPVFGNFLEKIKNDKS